MVWRLTKFSWVRSWSQLTIQCVFASLNGKKKSSFHLFLQTSKIVAFRHRKPARIHWKGDAPRTSHSLVWILVQRHNWAIFLRKWARRTDSCSQELKIRILATFGRRYVPHSRSSTRCFAPCFWISHYQPQSWCRLSTSELRGTQ